MKVVAGRLKGLKLAPVGKAGLDDRLRPTSARLRTSIFDMLAHGPEGDLVTGARVLDLFAGTGAMGIEAISRGAAAATFVDNGRPAHQLLRANIRRAGIEESTKLLAGSAIALGANGGMPHDLVFVDPPYGRGMAVLALQSARAGAWLAESAVAVVEDSACTDFPRWLQPITSRHYRNAEVWILRRSEVSG